MIGAFRAVRITPLFRQRFISVTKTSLSAKVDIDDKQLTVSCALTNETGMNIYVFVVLWTLDKDGKAVPDSCPMYASIDDRRVLHLGKVVHPLPREKFVEQRIVPFAKVLGAGQTWQEKLEFRLPVREYNPYYLATDQTLWDEVSVGALQVCVDYFIEADGLKLHATPLEGSFRLEHPELLKRIQRVTSGTIAVKAPALRRTEKFERFAC